MLPQRVNDLDRRAYARQMRVWKHPNVTSKIVNAVTEPLNRPYVANKLANMPDDFHKPILNEYLDRSLNGDEAQANKWLRESVDETFANRRLALNADDNDITEYAEEKAKMVHDILATQMINVSEAVINWIDDICKKAGINPPHQNTLLSKIQRVCDPKWWRKRLRKDLMQRREAGAIKLGFVHSKAGLYISNYGLERQRQQNKRSLEFLQGMEAVNELGEVIDLSEIFESNVCNPKIRFIEMVTRVKGIEEYAKQLGLIGIFTTTTCPSSMHARRKDTSRRNGKYDGTTPKEAHQYLCKQWSKTRAECDRQGINLIFLRIAEPHHDGTPHWHTLVFVDLQHKVKLIQIMRHYALERDGNERGAKDTRFKSEDIDLNKGSAVGYVIKYIAKNVDGKNVGLDYESINEDATTTVERVTAWARTWGIRQFQFSENCPVTIYRELRKLRTSPKIESIKPQWQACSDGDFHGFIKAMMAAPLVLVTEKQQSNRYPDEQIDVIRGVKLNEDFLETRIHTWVFRKKDCSALPWTCVNNCTNLINIIKKKCN